VAIESEPNKFMTPSQSDLRYNWLLVRLAAIDMNEMRRLILDAWQMVVPSGSLLPMTNWQSSTTVAASGQAHHTYSAAGASWCRRARSASAFAAVKAWSISASTVVSS